MIRRSSIAHHSIKKRVSISTTPHHMKNKLGSFIKNKRRSTLKRKSILSPEKIKFLLNLFYMKLRIVKKNLLKYSYNISDIYYKCVISNILNKNSSYHGKYKEMLLSIDESEFIPEYYSLRKSFHKINILGIIANNLDKIYPSYLGTGFEIYFFMSNYLSKKQQLIKDIEKEIENKMNGIKIKRNEFKKSSTKILENVVLNGEESKKSFSINYDISKQPKKKLDESIKEITKLIKKINLCEEGTFKKIKDNNKKQSDNKKKDLLLTSTKIRSFRFSSPTLNRDINNKLSNLDLSSNENRKKKRLLSSYIRNLHKKKIEHFNSQIILNKQELKQIDDLYKNIVVKKKISSLKDFVEKKMILEDISQSECSNNTINRTIKSRSFRKTNEFIINKKKPTAYSELNKFINECINNPFKVVESMKENEKKIMNKIKIINKDSIHNSRNITLHKLPIHHLKNNSNIFLSHDGFSQEIPATPKFVKNVNKIKNIKLNYDKIGKNYYYNSLFNSDGFQRLEKTYLRSDNYESFSSRSKKNCSISPSIFNSSDNNKIKCKRIINKNILQFSNSLCEKKCGRNSNLQKYNTNLDSEIKMKI